MDRGEAAVTNPLRGRDFALLIGGRFVSQTGTQMMDVALMWHVYQLAGGAPLALGAVGLARAVPMVLTALWGGILADRLNRRRVLMVTQVAYFAVSFALAALTLTGRAELWMLYVAVALSGAVTGVDNPARQSIVANVVPPESLSRAMAQASTAFNLARIGGPALGGLMLTRWTPGEVYAVDAATFLVMLACVAAVRYRPLPRPPGDGSLREGFAYLRRQPVVWSTMLLDFGATFFADALKLMPIFAADIFRRGPEGLGMLLAAHGAGSVAAGLVYGMRALPRRQGLTVVVAVVVYGAAYAGFGLSQNFTLSMVLLAAAGAADSVSSITRVTLRQVLTPDELRGRMNAINMIFFIGGPQLGELEAGVVAQHFTPRIALVSGGLACMALGIAFALYRPLRTYQHERGNDVSEA